MGRDRSSHPNLAAPGFRIKTRRAFIYLRMPSIPGFESAGRSPCSTKVTAYVYGNLVWGTEP